MQTVYLNNFDYFIWSLFDYNHIFRIVELFFEEKLFL